MEKIYFIFHLPLLDLMQLLAYCSDVIFKLLTNIVISCCGALGNFSLIAFGYFFFSIESNVQQHQKFLAMNKFYEF